MKKICMLLLVILGIAGAIYRLNDISVSKEANRYYILEDYLEQKQDKYDVQIYGSCHAYTSFNPEILVDEYGISCFNMANPSEIIPVTYLRLLEQFKTNIPKVVLVETWGINAYETYIGTGSILGHYLFYNIERLPITAEKMELINSLDVLDKIEDNFSFFRYKSRLTDFALTEVDFAYSLAGAESIYKEGNAGTYQEMKNRLSHYGFKSNVSNSIENYAELQPDIEATDMLQPEQIMLDYLNKIIDLCNEKGVTLIFYRAPYISTANELRKVNYLEAFFQEKNIPFFDLEKVLSLDYQVDFEDKQHLSAVGAQKATTFLIEQIMPDLSMK